jgi:hypothetical protein
LAAKATWALNAAEWTFRFAAIVPSSEPSV